MSSIVQLLIISVVTYMAQSVPLCQSNDECGESVRTDVLVKEKNRSELQNQIVHLYCVAISFHSTVGRNQTAVKDVQLPKISMQNKNFNGIFNHCSHECKNFITALSLKQQLQEYWFNQADAATVSQYIRPIHSMLVYLQTMANIFDEIEFNKRSSRCVRLTAAEYKMMYYAQYEDASLLESLIREAGKWINAKYYQEHLQNTVPSTCTCKILHPSLDCI